MKKQPVDYSGFSLKKLTDPRFRHMLLLLGWLVYFAMYFITENLIPLENCHVIHSCIDDLIPFNEYFMVFYAGWYVLVVGALAYTLFFDVKRFRQIEIYIMITQALAMLCYIVYPSVQHLRPDHFERNNIFTWLLGLIYAFDTPSGVCPSLHVCYSVGILSTALKDHDLPVGFRIFLTFFVIMICLSVCFVKQHSFIDVIAAVPVCLIAEAIVFGKSFWLPKIKKLHS